MQLEKITWPVFKLGNRQPQVESGVVYYHTELLDNEENDLINTIKIVDDQNLPQKTLGLRRLNIDKDSLSKISTAIYTLQDLVKLATPKVWFIDNSGAVFQYKKSTRAKLQIYKIKQVLPVSGIGCVLEVDGLVERFKSLTIPNNEKYAAILHYNGKTLFYGLCNEKIKSTWRLV